MAAHEIAVIAAFLAATAAFFTVIGFWTRLSDRITKANSSAEVALQEAVESKQDLDALRTETKRDTSEVRVAIAALDGRHSLFREQVAREYVDKDSLREVEARVIAAIEKAAKASSDQMGQLSKRIDSLSDGRRHT